MEPRHIHTWLPWQYRLLLTFAVVAGIIYAQTQYDLARSFFKEGDAAYYQNTPSDLLRAENYYTQGLLYGSATPDHYFRLGHAASRSGNYEYVRLGLSGALAVGYEHPSLDTLRSMDWNPALTPLNPTIRPLAGTAAPDPALLTTWEQSKLPGDLKDAGFRYLWLPNEGWLDTLTDVQRELAFKNPSFYVRLYEGLSYSLYEAVGEQRLATYGFSPEDFAAFEATPLPPGITEQTIILNPTPGQLASRPDVVALYGVHADGKTPAEKQAIFAELKVLRQVILPTDLNAEQQAHLQKWLTTFDPGDFPDGIESVVLHEAWISSLSATQQQQLRDPEHYKPLAWQVNFYYEIYGLYDVQR